MAKSFWKEFTCDECGKTFEKCFYSESQYENYCRFGNRLCDDCQDVYDDYQSYVKGFWQDLLEDDPDYFEHS